MKELQKLFSVVFLFITVNFAYSQKSHQRNLWTEIDNEKSILEKGRRGIVPEKYSVHKIDFEELKNHLNQSPLGYNSKERLNFVLPTPKGNRIYKIVETPLFSEEQQLLHPNTKTFSGYDKDRPNEWIKIDYTPVGFHAMVLSNEGGGIFIDPFQKNDTEHYIVYFKNDLNRQNSMQCLVDEASEGMQKLEKNGPVANKMAQGDCQLRTYRLAIAATAEYTAYHGSVANADAAITTTMNRVNGLFERDLAITMTRVSGTNVIYSSNPDPYTNSDGLAMLGQNQSNLDAVVGSANYDIGHVFSTGGGGIASLNSPCNNSAKARGVTGSSVPENDPFDVDYVAHEMGHQYGGNHAFNSTNGNCSTRNAGTAYEPGGGTSIQSYAGICGASNIQSNSDAFYHAVSIAEMSANVISGTSSTCPVTSTSGNSEPVANGGNSYVIPEGTPFQLTGSVSDVDGADVHTYSWEQYDLGGSQNQPTSTSTTQPNFRSFLPSTSPTRYFPQLSDILAGNNSTQWEMMPTVSRTMNFRLTVRDNSAGGYGCTDSDDVTVTTSNGIGPFVVTYPNASGITWTGGTTETVTWNVANTTNAPVSCSNVDILLSTDGGITFPYILESNVTNDGSHPITVPNLPTTTARVKIICNGNIFFDISNNNFTINATPTTDPEISFVTSSFTASESASPDGNLDCRPYKDYMVTMGIANPPTGDATVTVNPSGTATNNVDYQIIGSPLTFADGLTANQTFTVRVINDAAVEAAESINLAYTISGATDAIAGSFNQSITVNISDDDDVPVAGNAPFYTENFESFGGFVGLATTAGWSQGAFVGGNEQWAVSSNGNLDGNSAFISTDFGTTVGYDNTTASDYLIRTPAINGAGRSGMVLTFDFIANGSNDDFGTLYYSTAPSSGITTLEGSSAGPYSGESSRLTRSVNLPASLDGTTFYIWWGWENDGDGSGSNQPFEIDNIKISEGILGTQIETSVTAVSDEKYLGPNQSVYFYNPSDGDLMAYIENTSAHDYGCTTVSIDRAGNGATQFQLNNSMYDVADKTYRVIPTTNNLTGIYSITMYYSETEIAGWESATGNVRANMELVKTVGNISAVTPANQQISTTSFATASLGAFGGDVTVNGNFSNGFSGFGIGDADGILSVGAVNLNGYLKNGISNLRWELVSGINADRFEIEFSTDGSNFYKIGSKGEREEYTFQHATEGRVNYYRLKLISYKSKAIYSNVIKLTRDEIISVHPNPFKDKLIVNGLKSKGQLFIRNIIGQTVKNQGLNNGYSVINTQDLPNGTYLITIKTENNTFVEKFIKSTK